MQLSDADDRGLLSIFIPFHEPLKLQAPCLSPVRTIAAPVAVLFSGHWVSLSLRQSDVTLSFIQTRQSVSNEGLAQLSSNDSLGLGALAAFAGKISHAARLVTWAVIDAKAGIFVLCRAQAKKQAYVLS